MKIYSTFLSLLIFIMLFSCKKEEAPIPDWCKVINSGYSIDKNFVDNDTSSIYYFRTILTATFAIKTRRDPPPNDPCAGDFQCESCWMSAWNTTNDTVHCVAMLGDSIYHLEILPKALIQVTNIPGYCNNPTSNILNFEYF